VAELDDCEFDGVYVSHWEVARFVVPAGRRFFGLMPRIEKWAIHFPAELPESLTKRLEADRHGPARYFRMRVRGRLGPVGNFSHKGICTRELFIVRVISCTETTEPGPTCERRLTPHCS
jgi:hypothetical protein